MFATLQAKLIAGAVVLALIAGVYGIIKYQDGKIDDLNQQQGASKVVTEVQKDTIEKQDESAKADDKIVGENVKEANVIRREDTAHKTNTQGKIKVIEDTFEPLPPTPENKAEKERQVSEAVIISLWQQYCTTGDNVDKGCSAYIPEEKEKEDV